MKTIKKSLVIILFTLLIISMTGWTGCNSADATFKDMQSNWKGLELTLKTYDEDSQVIDKITGKSVNISPDNKFELTDSEGNVTEKSSVISMTVGGKSVVHVGSSMIVTETGVVDIFEEYTKTVDITNMDRSTPVINKLANSMKNLTKGNNYLILIRSQTGKPLATFAGNSVSYFSTGIDKSTGLLIDGHYMFIYRCDYTIYDLDLLK